MTDKTIAKPRKNNRKKGKREPDNVLIAKADHPNGGLRKGDKITRAPLTSISGCITETARVYRAAKSGKIKHDEARSLVWILDRLRQMLESQSLERIEEKLAALSAGGSGLHRGSLINGHIIADHRSDRRS